MHEIAALVVSARDARKLMSEWPAARVVIQGQGVCVFALRSCLEAMGWEHTDAVPDLEAADVGSALRRFLAPLIAKVRSINASDDFCMIFTQYWGGAGTQAAVSVTHSGMLSSLTLGDDAINDALHQMGVESTAVEDAFKRVGLHTWRGDEGTERGAG